MGQQQGPSAVSRQVSCPACGAVLLVPEGCASRVAKCGQCKQKFWLPRRLAVSEEAVVQWIGPRDLEEEDRAAPHDEPHPFEPRVIPAGHADHATAHDTLLAIPAEPLVRLITCDEQGVLLEFPSHRLKDGAFRSAMPRACMQCGARSHLEAHVIIYTGALVDSVSLEAEHSAGKMVLSADETKDLGSMALLSRLPKVPNVPPPADLPMPYWLCDLCRTAKAVSGQIQIHSETGAGSCRLRIRALRRAEEFLSAVGARGTDCYRKLVKQLAAAVESPWDTLPLVVQHRVEQWYRPAGGESFLAYVPDRDRARTEDGMDGLVVSDARLVYHGARRHYEWKLDEAVDLLQASDRLRGKVQVTISPQGARLTVDGEGIARLRRALAQGRFRATWR